MPEEWCRLSVNQRILVNKVLGCEICKIGQFYDEKCRAISICMSGSALMRFQLESIQEFLKFIRINRTKM
jgi:hypothetical protein